MPAISSAFFALSSSPLNKYTLPPGSANALGTLVSSTSGWIDVSSSAGSRTASTSLVKAACPDALLQVLPPNTALTCPSATSPSRLFQALGHQRRQPFRGERNTEQNHGDDRNRRRQRPADNSRDAVPAGNIVVE